MDDFGASNPLQPMSPNSNINEALPSELLVAVFERATGGAGLGQLRLVCRHWAGVAGTFYRRLFAQAVAAAGGVGATCGDRLWQTVKGEVRAYLRDVWTADRGLGDTGKWSREFLWANQPVDPGNASFEAQELYRGIIRAHFAGIAPGCSPEDLALLRSSFIRSIDAQPSSSTEAAAIHLLLYRLAYLRLRVLTKLSSKSMLYVDAQDRLRLVRRPTEPLPEPSPSDGALENVETSKEEPALPTLLPFLPKVDASADPIAVFSPHGTRIIFVCSKDVSPSSTLPFPDDKRPKRKKAPEWPNFGPEINQRCLVSCWTDGTDWREMDLTWVITFSTFCLTYTLLTFSSPDTGGLYPLFIHPHSSRRRPFHLDRRTVHPPNPRLLLWLPHHHRISSLDFPGRRRRSPRPNGRHARTPRRRRARPFQGPDSRKETRLLGLRPRIFPSARRCPRAAGFAAFGIGEGSG